LTEGAGGRAAAARFAETRSGTVAFAIAGADGRVRGVNLDVQFRSASMTKAMLLIAVLRDAGSRPLTPDEDGLLRPMIVRSSNKAARKVYKTQGDAGLVEVARAARMTHFLPAGALFEARITAADQARLFLRIDRLVPRRHRPYARELLGGIVERQRWGIAPVAERRGFRIFFKGGWRKGITHQAALLERDGRRVALAVLTSDEPTRAYGSATLAGVAARVLNP
jgi:hypothetical protein